MLQLISTFLMSGASVLQDATADIIILLTVLLTLTLRSRTAQVTILITGLGAAAECKLSHSAQENPLTNDHEAARATLVTTLSPTTC